MNLEQLREVEKINLHTNRTKDPHQHSHLELIIILEGEMELTENNRHIPLKQNDIYIINSGCKHSYRTARNTLYGIVKIPLELLGESFHPDNCMLLCDSTKKTAQNAADYDAVLEILRNLLLCSNMVTRDKNADFRSASHYYHLLEYLMSHYLVFLNTSQNRSVSENRRLAMERYIQANYSQPLQLCDVADHLHVSTVYVSRIFPQIFGMNFSEYLTQVRLSHACEELQYGDKQITQIAYNNGFSTPSSFDRIFKNTYGIRPTEYREKNRISAPSTGHRKEDINHIKLQLEQYFLEKGKTATTIRSNQRTIFSAFDTQPLTPYWNLFVNVGSASDLLRQDLRETIEQLHKTMGFRYIRFWNQFSEDMYVNVNAPNKRYNFSKLDQVVDLLLSLGCKPYLDMEQKDKQINQNELTQLVLPRQNETFQSIEHLADVLCALIDHWISRYGADEVSTWILEIGQYSYEGVGSLDGAGYLKLFERVYSYVHNLLPDMQIGGCGRPLYFLQETDENGVMYGTLWAKSNFRPDFLSTFCFAYEYDQSANLYMKRSTDTAFLEHKIEEIFQMSRMFGFQDIKIRIAEWNLTISDRNLLSDTCFQGAYILQNLLDNYGKIDGLGYFIGADYYSEYYDSQQLLYGGQGLLTCDHIYKPAAFAYDFMNRLYHNLVGKQKHYLITKNKKSSFGIVCHNIKKLNYYYYLTDNEKLDATQIWKYFEEMDELEINISIKDVPNGSYRLKIYRINEEHGSVFDLWKNARFLKECSLREIQYFQKLSEPQLLIDDIAVTDGCLNITPHLLPNEICFIQIQPE